MQYSWWCVHATTAMVDHAKTDVLDRIVAAGAGLRLGDTYVSFQSRNTSVTADPAVLSQLSCLACACRISYETSITLNFNLVDVFCMFEYQYCL